MGERAFWLLLMATVRLPFAMRVSRTQAWGMAAYGFVVLVVARYTGWNIAEGRWCRVGR